jgi:two-component system invasion response regulator UvrY
MAESVDAAAISTATATATGVLVVDDQQLFRSVASSVVRLIDGWHVLAEAGSGEEAVARAHDTHPSVVIMDINLPGISGIEATRRIVAEYPDARVVLVSTYAPDDLPADALDSGAIGYLRKEEMSPRTLAAAAAGKVESE